jgi:hypothetical protein
VRGILRALRRQRTIAAFAWNPSAWVMLQVFVHAATFSLMMGPRARWLPDLVVELAAYSCITGIWVVAHMLGLAGAGTGAGLRLAALALAGRVTCETYVGVLLFSGADSVYDAWPSVGPWIWFMRNVGLALFAYGLALTLFAVVSDAVLRRRHPAWVPPLED